MLASNDNLKELYKCHVCDCETKRCGICTWQGQICAECFDVTTYCHRRHDVGRQGTFVKDEQPNEVDVREITYPRISEITTEGNGDCLYDSLAKGLVSDHTIHSPVLTVELLRLFVSRMQTQNNFAAYKAAYELKEIHTLRSFKNTLQRCGEKVGPDKCLWGDENTIGIVANDYRLRFVIFDQAGKSSLFEANRQYAAVIMFEWQKLK